jgi:hypothetical protein
MLSGHCRQNPRVKVAEIDKGTLNPDGWGGISEVTFKPKPKGNEGAIWVSVEKHPS